MTVCCLSNLLLDVILNYLLLSSVICHLSTKKESPDVETPGLLVKALISSYFDLD
jgi:hypothetical protein